MSEPLSGQPPEVPEPGATDPAMQAYIRSNTGRYTEEALTAALVAAGHDPTSVRAAMAAAAAAQPAVSARPRAVRIIIIAYVATFALLSAGMLVNIGKSFGEFIPSSIGGIGLLAVSLGVAFGVSMVWVTSRRVFWLIAAILYVPVLLAQGIYGVPWSLVAIAVLGAALWFTWRPAKPGAAAGTPVEILLVIPIVLMLGVAGLCVASGLPIPGVGR